MNKYGTIPTTTDAVSQIQKEERRRPLTRVIDAFWAICTSTIMIHVILIVIQMLYSGFGMIGGDAAKSISPFVFAMLRLTLMMASFSIMSFFVDYPYWTRQVDDREACCGRNILPNWSDGLIMMVLGLLVCFNVFSYILALSLTDFTFVAIIQPTNSIFACIISVALKKEKGSILKFAGVLLAVIGSVVTLVIISFVGSGNGSAMQRFDVKAVVGIVLEIMNSISVAFYFVLQKSLLSRGIPPLTINAWSLVTAFPIGLTIGSFFLKDVLWSSVPPIAWIALVYSGLAIGFGTFALNAFANKHSSPVTITVYNTTAPLFACVFKLVFKREMTTPYALFGAVAITAGVLLVAVARHREAKPQSFSDKNHVEPAELGTDITQVNSESDLLIKR